MKRNRVELVLAFCTLVSLCLIAGDGLQFWIMERWLRVLSNVCFVVGMIGLLLLGMQTRREQDNIASMSEPEDDLDKG